MKGYAAHMNRGTTPTITFSTPLKAEDVAALSVVFTDKTGAVLIQKTLPDVTVCDYAIIFTLSQTETLGLPDGGITEAQIRIRDTGGIAYASNIVSVDSGRILKTGVI